MDATITIGTGSTAEAGSGHKSAGAMLGRMRTAKPASRSAVTTADTGSRAMLCDARSRMSVMNVSAGASASRNPTRARVCVCGGGGLTGCVDEEPQIDAVAVAGPEAHALAQVNVDASVLGLSHGRTLRLLEAHNLVLLLADNDLDVHNALCALERRARPSGRPPQRLRRARRHTYGAVLRNRIGSLPDRNGGQLFEVTGSLWLRWSHNGRGACGGAARDGRSSRRCRGSRDALVGQYIQPVTGDERRPRPESDPLPLAAQFRTPVVKPGAKACVRAPARMPARLTSPRPTHKIKSS